MRAWFQSFRYFPDPLGIVPADVSRAFSFSVRKGGFFIAIVKT